MCHGYFTQVRGGFNHIGDIRKSSVFVGFDSRPETMGWLQCIGILKLVWIAAVFINADKGKL